MKDEIATRSVALADSETIMAILQEVCRITDMGFAAVARVTEDRWIACQLLDKIEFGLNPGDELEIKTTICDEIRDSGRRVVIDHVDADIEWQTHHTPRMYGFKSYVSIPVVLPDGSFFGTLCAIDPRPRTISGAETIAILEDFARQVAQILTANGAMEEGDRD